MYPFLHMHEHDSMLIGNYKSNKSISLVTAKGWEIPNERRPREANMEIQRATAKMLIGTFPEISLRSLAWDYNCVGLVFASRRTAIDPKFLPKILEDDGYRLTSLENVTAAI